MDGLVRFGSKNGQAVGISLEPGGISLDRVLNTGFERVQSVCCDSLGLFESKTSISRPLFMLDTC